MLEKIKPDSIYKVYLYLSLAYVLSAFAETRGTLNKKNVLYVGTEQAFVDECCTMTKEMVSKAADVAFNDELLSTVVGGCANIRIACACSICSNLIVERQKKRFKHSFAAPSHRI